MQKNTVVRLGVSPAIAGNKIWPLRSHLYNYAYWQKQKLSWGRGRIIFRVDDTGETGTSSAAIDKTWKLYDFLMSLGMHFDVTPQNARDTIWQSTVQSERGGIYLAYLEDLQAKQLVRNNDDGSVFLDLEEYRNLHGDEFAIPDMLAWNISTRIHNIFTREQNLFPLFRSDGSVLYHFASAIDDEEFGVTNVIRGIDKFSAAWFQEILRIALWTKEKMYLHTPLLLDKNGAKLWWKTSFTDFVNQWIASRAVMSYMLSSGYADPSAIYGSLDEFVDQFEYGKIHRKSSKFDFDRMSHINRKLIREMWKAKYIASVVEYLDCTWHENMSKAILNDIDLQSLLFDFKRPMSAMLSILKGVLDPDYGTEIGENTKLDALRIIEAILLSPHWQDIVCLDWMDQDKFNLALRWILTWQCTSPDIFSIRNYLISKSKILERIKIARKFL